MKLSSIAFIGLLAVVGVASAGWFDDAGTNTKNLDSTINTDAVNIGQSWHWEAKVTEKNQQELAKKYPPLMLEDSLERQNLRRRYKHLNDRDVVHHVYLMSYGKVVAYYTAQGKVSSVNSKLTQPQQLVKCDRGDGSFGNRDDDCVVDSPQMDGSYGTNGAAIFFFTTDGKYVEWNGEYLVSDQPLNIQTPVTLTKKVGSSSGGGQ